MRQPLSHSRAEVLERRRLLSFVPYDGDLSEEVEFTGLDLPVAVEFASTGRVFVAEKGGVIKTYDSLEDKSATVALDIQDVTNNSGDRGLLGLAVSPTFGSDGYVYVLYTFDGDVGQAARTTDLDNIANTVSGKLVRYQWDGTALVNPTMLIHDWPQQYPSHSIGHLQFGPDGYLYASGGDGASFTAVDYGQNGNPFGDPVNEGGALRAQDLLSNGDPAGLNGSIIRIDPATGAGAPGNPRAASSDTNAQRIIAYGLRNPYRFNFRPGTSEVWIAEVGWVAWEEIDRLIPSTTATRNFGWPAKEGNGDQNGYKNANLPLLSGIYNGTAPTVGPYFTYNHNNKIDAAASNEPVGGSSASGVAFYSGNTYPYEDYNALFFADYARQSLYMARAGNNGLPDMSTARLIQTGVYPVELQAGANGDIFYVDIAFGKVVRITAKGPKARLSVDHTTGAAPLTVNFDASASTDPDALDQLTFTWDLDNDGAFDDATGPTASKTYLTSGTFTARVKVTDFTDLSDIEAVTINVDSFAPVPSFTGPMQGLWSVGSQIAFSGTATDAENGTIPASRLRFEFILMHANEANPNTPAHEHHLAVFTGVSGGTFTAIDHEYPSWLELRMTATDSDGNSTTIARRLDPLTTAVTVGASTPGVSVAFNDGVYATPFTRTVIAGSTNSLSLDALQSVAGYDWIFDRWNDTKSNGRTYVAPAGGRTLQVNGRLQAWRRLEGRPISSVGSLSGGAGDAPPRAFDGDASTGFQSAMVNGWLGVNLGGVQRVSRFGIAPLAGVSMVGGTIQASNALDFATPTTLYTFSSTPADGVITNFTEGDGVEIGAYRYYRYLAPVGGFAGIGEFQLSSSIAYANGRGTQFGSAAKSSSTAMAFAFDGKLDTNYEASKPDKAWIGLDLGAPTTLDLIRFAPKLTEPSKMRGGKFQFANTADFSDAVTVLKLYDTPRAGWNEMRVSAPGTFRYARYLGPNGSASKISEFAVLTAPPTPVPATAGKVSILTADAQQGVNLVWGDTSILETGVRIRRQIDGGSATTLANLPANSTAFHDTSVLANHRYSYRVIPLNGSGYGGDTGASVTIAPTGTAPAQPTNLTAIDQPAGVALSWIDVSSNETAYRIERRFTADVWAAIATLDAGRSSYLDASALSQVSYDYRVVAVNGIGETTSDAVTVQT